MTTHVLIDEKVYGDSYLLGRGSAWFAYVMTVALMIFDYVDRQIIVSMFPHLKAHWNLTDQELGALVSVVSITVAALGLPVAWLADRMSRVRSIVIMAITWSLACIGCMFAQNYSQLLLARAIVGVGEAGYGSVGAAMISTHFPSSQRSALLGGFFASASVGSVLGVILGGVIASRYGWQAGFGIVGIPGFVVALLYIFVRDYSTVTTLTNADGSPSGRPRSAMMATIFKSHTMWWICIGAAAQLIAVSSLWSWLPSYLNRTYAIPADRAGVQAALVVLAGAVGSAVLGGIADVFGRRSQYYRFVAIACMSLLTCAVLAFAFGSKYVGIMLEPANQFTLIVLGGFFATCTVGPAAAVVIDVIHPGVRSTGASVLSLFQNLFGLAVGPFIAGTLSDSLGLDMALTLTPMTCIVAAVMFLIAGRSYAVERRRPPTREVAMAAAIPVSA